MNANIKAGHERPLPLLSEPGVARIPDALHFSETKPLKGRLALLLSALAVGAMGGLALHASALPVNISLTYGGSLTYVGVLMALVGGVLSTWSPCGYSSLSLLRPAGRYSLRTVTRWTPTFITHALGYALGALVLGGMLGGAGWLLFAKMPAQYPALALAVLALGYGAHQMGFLKMPYPQRRAQVPHDARFRFRSSTIGFLYGYALGMNYLTYVQTPMLYIVTGIALFSADLKTAISIIALFNLGRCLPVAVNFFPVRNQTVQAWLARWQERAVEIDGFVLLAAGTGVCLLLAL